jgi:hypothetical protein
VHVVFGLHCACSTTVELLRKHESGLHPPPPHTKDHRTERRTSVIRRRSIENGAGLAAEGSKAGGPEAAAQPGGPLKPCCFFSLDMNDEEGVVHAYCRRCNRKILVYDRALYWGVKRQSGEVPPTYPYSCSCGGHTLEVALGFEYPAEPLDENDLETITVAVRCAGCGEVAVIFADEAT